MDSKPKNILVIRFSAMGDVVLTVPVIQNLLKIYPDIQITILTKPFLNPFFEGVPNLSIFPIDLKGTHKGAWGLYTLVRELTVKQKYDCVIDLHDVIRSRVISTFFRAKGVPIYRIDKGRKEKRAFIKGNRSKILPHTTKRYQEVFYRAGFVFPLEKVLLPELKEAGRVKEIVSKFSIINIGIAPFAAHKSKEWGLSKIHRLIKNINKHYEVHFYLFGGGVKEVGKLNALANNYTNVTNLAGLFSLREEMQLLRNLSVLIGMDSGNMHIASLVGIPVISIWGGTHPGLGFKALYQPDKNSIQLSLENQKGCKFSVYGTSKPQLKESPYFCIQKIKVKSVIDRLLAIKVLS